MRISGWVLDTCWKRLHVTAFEIELRQCRNLAEDGEGSFILGQCMAMSQVEVFEGCHLTKPFGQCPKGHWFPMIRAAQVEYFQCLKPTDALWEAA